MVRSLLLAAGVVLLGAAAPARTLAAGPVRIVAAENFYGDVARQVGGAAVAVTSVLSNPDQDPHLFEASPSVARGIAGADIIVANGLGYDPWMSRLAASAGRHAVLIDVGRLLGRKAGDNPHVWYDPATMPLYARALAAAIDRADPAAAAATGPGLARFEASLAPLRARVAAIRARDAGTPVAATEPVFGDMADALGFVVHDGRLALAIMNDAEPSARDVAAAEADLRTHRVRLLFANGQASDPAADRLVAIARASGVPVVAVSETEPPGVDYQTWMARTLDAVAGALGR